MKINKTLIIVIAILLSVLIGITITYFVLQDRYIVTYDLTGGEMEIAETYVWYNKYYELPTPTKDGFYFAGWYCDGEYIESAGIWAYESDKMLTATWEIRDENGFVFEPTDGGYIIVGYKGVAKAEIAVPKTYESLPVLGIKDDAFHSLSEYLLETEATRVIFYIPNSINNFTDSLFYNPKMKLLRYDYITEDGMYVQKTADGKDGFILSGYSGVISDRVVIPQGCVSILDGSLDVLKDCADKEGLMVIFIPMSVEAIEENAVCSDKMKLVYYSKIGKNNLVYFENENDVTVVGYCGEYKENIVIPLTVNDKPVTAIGDLTFCNATNKIDHSASNFLRILFSENIAKIGDKAFASCGGIKLCIYYVTENLEVREVIDSARLYDWILNTQIGTGNADFEEVVCQTKPAFGWTVYSSAYIYVRFDTDGGVLVADGKEITDMEIKNKSAYSLPIPTKEGYTFEGWYADGVYVPNEGERWGYTKYITLVAHWVENAE